MNNKTDVFWKYFEKLKSENVILHCNNLLNI